MADEATPRRYPPYFFPPYPGHPPGMPHPPFPPHHYPPHMYPPGWAPPPHPGAPLPEPDDTVTIPEPDDTLTIPEPDPVPEIIPHPQPHFGYGYYWVDCDANTGVYSTSVRGGVDQDGTQIYVGRAFHAGDWIPAKVIPEKNVAYIAYDGKEIAMYQYQVLCEQRFDWQPCSGGNIPSNAVIGGRTADGELLYVGRAYHEGSHTVGKVHPSHGSCYIPFDGEEVAYQDYEILVLR
ncbi:hypothetical protein MML48_6g00016043 [Holotrichia oblita]|uniref:Uncharacterized protein n=1 Tax=Holotrichia oblita TaxID=644536 RepID=A0ACB9SXL3_HOLOL|nr:hypothetical protein MML48_6g00016043 [Holotrichia oblita]